jgi:hypothetical protein
MLTTIAIGANAQTDRATPSISEADLKAYEDLRVPDISSEKFKRQITVAVIDDAFNLTHQALQPFIQCTPSEIPNNGMDDDGNGFVDDAYGWDFADTDSDVSVPPGRASNFYHGTMVASIVTQLAKRGFGDDASEWVRILPVKVVSDRSSNSDYSLGYNAIGYAVGLNADIIVCAWGGGKYDSDKYERIFNEAQQKGILIIAATGNFFSEQTDPPASIASVYAIAAVDSSWHKTRPSNYGLKVDLVAPGEFVLAAHSDGGKSYGYLDGTSSATAMVGGCAAILKAARPDAAPDLLMKALKNTATPVDSLNQFYGGKLGSGFPNLTAAYDYLTHPEKHASYFSSTRPEGEIIVSATNKGSWTIDPYGGYEGLYFTGEGEWNSSKAQLKFYVKDSLVNVYGADEFPPIVFIKGGPVRFEVEGKLSKKPSFLTYASLPVDSTKLYCSGTQYFDKPSGVFTDGSRSADYAPNCDCKWLITVPEGKRVKLWFDEFDTEAKVDFVHLFAGDATLQENMLAKFSGPDLPPVIVSGGNQVLVWFVTSQTHHGKGWRLNYCITEEESGVYPPVK